MIGLAKSDVDTLLRWVIMFQVRPTFCKRGDGHRAEMRCEFKTVCCPVTITCLPLLYDTPPIFRPFDNPFSLHYTAFIG